VVTRQSAVMFCLGASVVLAWLFAIAGVPDAIAVGIGHITDSRNGVIAVMLLVYLVVGTFMDPLPAILIFSPIFQPIAHHYGISNVHFTVTMVMGLAIGLATPPVGSCLYVGAAISGLTIDKFAKDLLPFLAAMVVALIIVAYIPALAEALPALVKR
jgi:TRAP-type C4-dicarboxylate transport system permease large subunit